MPDVKDHIEKNDDVKPSPVSKEAVRAAVNEVNEQLIARLVERPSAVATAIMTLTTHLINTNRGLDVLKDKLADKSIALPDHMNTTLQGIQIELKQLNRERGSLNQNLTSLTSAIRDNARATRDFTMASQASADAMMLMGAPIHPPSTGEELQTIEVADAYDQNWTQLQDEKLKEQTSQSGPPTPIAVVGPPTPISTVSIPPNQSTPRGGHTSTWAGRNRRPSWQGSWNRGQRVTQFTPAIHQTPRRGSGHYKYGGHFKNLQKN